MAFPTLLSTELRQIFGEKVYKLPLHTGFSCPTRDGSKGAQGCHYCGATGSYFSTAAEQAAFPSVSEQLRASKEFLERKCRARKYLAYFQAYTSTYGDVAQLEQMCAEAVAAPYIVGLSLATRPDCLSPAVLTVLAKVMRPRYHWLEIGAETTHAQTLAAIGRGHTYQDFVSACQRAQAEGLRVCAHLIFGLPGETEAMMLESVERLLALGVAGFKFHNLHVVKNSVFAQEYVAGRLPLWELPEYAALLVKVCALLPAEVIVHRLMGDAPASQLIAPEWCRQKSLALTYIKERLG